MSKKEVNNGYPFVLFLSLVFMNLHYFGIINWKWFWLMSPMLISIGISIVILFILSITIIVKTLLR